MTLGRVQPCYLVERNERNRARERRGQSHVYRHTHSLFFSLPLPLSGKEGAVGGFLFLFFLLWRAFHFLKKQGIQVINGPCARTRRAYRRWGRQVVADAKEVVLCLGTRDDGETRRQHEKESRRGDTLPDSGASSLFTLHRHQLPASPFPSF